jgi:hypothetical protein
MTSSLTKLPAVSFILQVKAFFDPKDRGTFLQAFKSCCEIVIKEEECAYFLVGESVAEPGVFRWTEGWRKDLEWFMGVSYLLPSLPLSDWMGGKVDGKGKGG